MIDIFGFQNEYNFFLDLAKQKMTEEKYRDIVHISNLFPQVLENFESFQDFKRMDQNSTKDIRFYLMQRLIL